jgi:hypothetical protein
MNQTSDFDKAIQQLEELRKRTQEQLTPSERLVMLELIEKEVDNLNVEADRLLAETA